MTKSAMRIEAVLKRFEHVRRRGKGWVARCPAHDDKNPSLSISVKNEKILIHCFAKCAVEDVCAAVGLKLSDFSGKASRHGGGVRHKGIIAAIYDYTDDKGKLLYQKVRYTPKHFEFRRPNGKGGWISNLNHTSRVLYRLKEVLAAPDVVVVEGEKDVKTAWQRGICATTGGSANDEWLEDYTVALTGKNVTIIADADLPGRMKAQTIGRALLGKAKTVRLCEMPGAKDITDWIDKGGTEEQLWQILRDAPEYTLATANGPALLDRLEAFIRRFVALSQSQSRSIALWIIHTYTITTADFTPYLSITSPEKRSGKTRLLEVLNLLVANPWQTSRASPAVLYRKIDAEQPTLLLDESDAAFGSEPEYAQTLRGILNSGFERGGKYSCCVGTGSEQSYKDFSTFCPKAIAGIGKLPDTVADRSIPIRLKRQASGDKKVERFRRRTAEMDALPLRREAQAYSLEIMSVLTDSHPEIPNALTDRQADAIDPILAIADAAGEHWPELARLALTELCSEAQSQDDSLGVRLLADIRQIFGELESDRIMSADLVRALAAIETSPWSDFSNGKPLTPARLARLLGPFKVIPHSTRIGDRTPKGYLREDFEEAWRRYLPARTVLDVHKESLRDATAQQRNTDAEYSESMRRNTVGGVAVRECEKLNKDGVSCAVAPSIAPGGTTKEGVEEEL